MALRDQLRADQHRPVGRAEALEHLLELPRRDVESASRRITTRSGNVSAISSSRRSVPAPMRAMSTAAQVGQARGVRSRRPQWWHSSAGGLAVQRERDVAVGAAERHAARAAVQRRRLAAAVQQQDRAPALVGDRAQGRVQRPRERIAAVAAQVDDVDRRQPAADALGQLDAAPAARQASGRGVAVASSTARAVPASPQHGDGAGVVARVGVLLVGRLVLLVDHDQAEVGDRREERPSAGRSTIVASPPNDASRTRPRARRRRAPECSTATRGRRSAR